MNYIFKTILSAVILFSAISGTIAQDSKEHKLVFTANAGLSLAGTFISVTDLVSDESYSTNVLPAGQLSADYYIIPIVSVGLAGSYQRMAMNYTDYGTENYNFSAVIGRTNIGIRGLYHYINKKHINMYSGIRFGMTNWNLQLSEDIPEFDPFEYVNFTNGTLASTQIVAFGIRAYFVDYLGVNVEFAIGAPHYVSAGINVRL